MKASELVGAVAGLWRFPVKSMLGKAVFDSRTPASNIETGTMTWSPPLRAHSVKNVGDTEIRVISVELKD